jgi:hypothetical protein
MAKRYRHSPLPENEEQQNQSVSQHSEKPTGAGAGAGAGQPEREPASLGRLHEIDLGQEAKLRNIERTEAATRGFASGESQPDRDRPGPAEDSKSRRNRKGRTSADIERDRLVEEVLRESKRKCNPVFLSFFPYGKPRLILDPILTRFFAPQWTSTTSPKRN